MASQLLASTRAWFGGYSACLAIGALLLGCGADAKDAEDTSADEVADNAAAPGAGEVVSGITDPAAPAECGAEFQACGGLLAGAWTVEGVCSGATRAGSAVQSWGQSVMGLDAAACPDAVQTVSSNWLGNLTFEDGVFGDQRLRTDRIELQLTRECLNGTFNVDIRPDKLASVCSTLTSGSTSCSPVSGACHCSVQLEEQADRASIYGVLGTSVAYGPERPPAVVDYCVEGDLLHWQEPDSKHHLLLRRVSGPPASDPQAPRLR